MQTKNEVISQYLSYYCSLKISPGYAVLVRGLWGSGKSFLVKEFLKSNPQIEHLYISLNGVASVKEIETMLFAQLHPILASKGMRLAGKLIKGLIKTTIKVDLNKDGKEDGSIASTIPDISLPEFLQNLENKILIFDDLERCSIPIQTILGYINQFIEENELKVIIIGNELEITNSSNKDGLYISIKEKLIGKSFDVVTDFDGALTSFFAELGEVKSRDSLLRNTQVIKEIFEIGGYNNLRHLRQAILDFDRFYKFLPAKAANHPKIMSEVIGIFFLISIELKKGAIDESQIPSLFSRPLHELFSEGQAPQPKDLKSKYLILNQYSFVIAPKLFQEFFKFGSTSAEELLASIDKSSYFIQDKIEPWVKLWFYYDLEESEFRQILATVYEDFKKSRIQDKYVVIHLVGMFIEFHKRKLFNVKPEVAVKQAKKILNKLKHEQKLLLPKNESFDIGGALGKGYMSLSELVFTDFLAYAKDLIENSQVLDTNKAARDLLDLLQTSPDDFNDSITLSNRDDLRLYYDEPVLQYITPAKFVDAFLHLKNIQKKQIAWALGKRFDHLGTFPKLKSEMDWVKRINEIFEKETRKKPQTVDRVIIENILIPRLKKAIASSASV